MGGKKAYTKAEKNRQKAIEQFEAEEEAREKQNGSADDEDNPVYRSGEAGRLAKELSLKAESDPQGKPVDKEFSDILKDIEELSTVEEYLNLPANKEHMSLKMKNEALATIFSGYKALSQKISKYLNEKNPDRKQSRGRYILMLRADTMVSAQMKALFSELSDITEEVFNQANVKAQIKEFDEHLLEKNTALMKMHDNEENMVDNHQFLEEFAAYMAMVDARFRTTDNNAEALKKENLDKNKNAFLSNGLAEQVLCDLEKNGFEKIKDNRFLYTMILEKAKEMDEIRKKEEQLEKQRQEQAKQKIKVKDERMKTFVLHPETWGLTKDDLKKCTDETNKAGISLTIYRTAVSTIAVGLMLSSKKPVYTTEQVFDLSKNQKARVGFGRKALELLNNHHFKEVHEMLYVAGQKTKDFENRCIKNMQTVSLKSLKNSEKSFDLFSIGSILQDVGQEIEKTSHYLYPGKPFESKVSRFLDEQLTLSQINGAVSNGIEAMKNIRYEDDLQTPMVSYLAGNLVCRYLNEFKNSKPSAKLWDIQKDKMMGNIANAMGDASFLTIKYPEMGNLIYSLAYRDKVKEFVENDTFADAIGLKIGIDEEGNREITVDENLIRKNFGSPVAEKKNSVPAVCKK